MKALFKLIPWFFILVLGFSSCEEDPVVIPTTKKYQVVASSGIGGVVTPSTSFVEEGKSLTVNIQPDFGYEIEQLKLDGQNVLCSLKCYTIKEIKKDYLLEVSFKETLKAKAVGRWRLDSLNIYNYLTDKWEYHKIYGVAGQDQNLLILSPGSAFWGTQDRLHGGSWNLIPEKNQFIFKSEVNQIYKLDDKNFVFGQKNVFYEVYFRE
jgi:hypothetical protein